MYRNALIWCIVLIKNIIFKVWTRKLIIYLDKVFTVLEENIQIFNILKNWDRRKKKVVTVLVLSKW